MVGRPPKKPSWHCIRVWPIVEGMVYKAVVKCILNSLYSSPLFYLFAAPKELFHSNFLYWLSLVNQKEFLKLICPAVGEVSILR
jgi:hypothetical protein